MPFAMASLYLARPSMAMTSPMRPMSGASHVAAMPMAWGKTVPSPIRATPWRASFHQPYAGTPSLGIAAALSIVWETISSSVIRSTRSLARKSGASDGSRYAQVLGEQVLTTGGFAGPVCPIRVEAEASAVRTTPRATRGRRAKLRLRARTNECIARNTPSDSVGRQRCHATPAKPPCALDGV